MASKLLTVSISISVSRNGNGKIPKGSINMSSDRTYHSRQKEKNNINDNKGYYKITFLFLGLSLSLLFSMSVLAWYWPVIFQDDSVVFSNNPAETKIVISTTKDSQRSSHMSQSPNASYAGKTELSQDSSSTPVVRVTHQPKSIHFPQPESDSLSLTKEVNAEPVMNQENNILLAERDRLQNDLQKTNTILSEVEQERDKLRKQLLSHAMPSKDGVITVKGGAVIVRDMGKMGLMLNEIHFSGSGSTELSPGAKKKIKAAAEIFHKKNKKNIRLYAFSDSIGSAEANLMLSEHRAEIVAAELASHGIDRDRIDIISRGENGGPQRIDDETDEPLNRCVGIFALE